ncbi:Shikimate kinase [Corynebacterium deserti GIMN1.010]|uniref:Shikimate kinase n=1 Tax=Corynebacterium deserti GIMN1.010 TaxID=931089 RepID=A0A0M5IM30_9CORY|nr:Shikimate kinase [Corynebacterium deserti GIMN1.010]
MNDQIHSEIESDTPRPIVVLVGLPGAGKSTIGRRLARALNTELVDSDELIERAAGKACGAVFAELGEPAFRELEAVHVAEALNSNGVVSLGGGAVLTESTRELLKGHDVVWIDVPVEEGIRRTANERSRPVLQAADPAAHYRNLVKVRTPLYEEVASYRLRTNNRSPQQVVAAVLHHLEND